MLRAPVSVLVVWSGDPSLVLREPKRVRYQQQAGSLPLPTIFERAEGCPTNHHANHIDLAQRKPMVGERLVARSRLRVVVVTWSLSDLNDPPRMTLAPARISKVDVWPG